MAKDKLTPAEMRQMLMHVCQGMVASKDLLTEADRAIGDGDHGIGMARGFEAVRRQLEAGQFAGIDELWRLVGQTLMAAVGGASGAVFGTLFRGGAKGLSGLQSLGSAELSVLLLQGLSAVQERGKARLGDKTMVDALEPAARCAAELAALPLAEALPQIAAAARAGADRTRDLIAQVGKAKTLYERSLGHPDPGAVSMALILQLMAEWVGAAQ